MGRITLGDSCVFGVMPIKPFNQPINGKIRLRLRHDDFAKAFVKTSESITCYLIKNMGDHWQLSHVQAINHCSKKDNHPEGKK